LQTGIESPGAAEAGLFGMDIWRVRTTPRRMKHTKTISAPSRERLFFAIAFSCAMIPSGRSQIIRQIGSGQYSLQSACSRHKNFVSTVALQAMDAES